MVSQFLINMETKLSIFKNYIFISFGIFIIGYILFVRLAINRFPRDLPVIDSTLKLIVFSVIPLCFLVLASTLLITKYKKSSNLLPEYLRKNLNILSKLYWKSLLSLNTFIVEKLPSNIFGENIMRFSLAYTTYLRLTKIRFYDIIYIVINFIPKFIFVLLLIYDVFYLKKFMLAEINYNIYNKELLVIYNIIKY